ncbi:hypothetical protein TNCV_2122811 [Trichonephila clavipes]|nr:hypothetical protein TNCV_2122811 [Trichonephila clavipes]
MMDRISICEALNKRNEIDPFLKRMVTGDEKDEDILDFVQNLKNIIDIDSDGENEMNNAAPVHTSSEKRSTMKSIRSYIDAHADGEINNNMEDFQQFVGNLMLKKKIH